MNEILNKLDKLEKKIDRSQVFSPIKKFFNAREAALYTGLSEALVRKLAKEIKFNEKKTKKLIFTKDELDTFMKKYI